MASKVAEVSFCPRCDNAYTGLAETSAEAKRVANNMVREHLKRAIGADLDDGLHVDALELWDETQEN